MNDIHDIKGLIEILPFWREHLLLSILILIFALACIAFLIFFLIKKLKKKSTSQVILSPYENAIFELTKTKEYMYPGLDKVLSIKISDVIRHYIENAFHLRASEKTTEEFLYNVQQENTFSSQSLSLLVSFLEMCDLAKFAKAEFTPHDQKLLYEKAHSFLNLAHQEEPQPEVIDSILGSKKDFKLK